MLDSPFAYCRVCRGYVLLDQTHRECMLEHGCKDVSKCELRELFSGIEFGAKKREARTDSGPHRD